MLNGHVGQHRFGIDVNRVAAAGYFQQNQKCVFEPGSRQTMVPITQGR